MKLFFTLTLTLFFFNGLFAQNGIVRGRVYNAQTNASVEGAKVQLIEQAKGAITLADGTFELTGLKPGVYSFTVSFIYVLFKGIYIYWHFNFMDYLETWGLY